MARICLLFVIAVVLTCVSERCCAIDEEYYLGDYYYDGDYDYSGKKCGYRQGAVHGHGAQQGIGQVGTCPVLGRNLVHLTVRLGFVTQHLWLGNFGKRNRGLRAQTLRLRLPSAN